jgi:hypothetical protein
LKIEEYNHSHQNGVNSLFEYVYDKKVIPEFFTWRYYYFGKPLRYVMINDDNSIIGHYVIHPIPFKILNNEEQIQFSMTVMTHPKFRNMGVFRKLANFIYDKASNLDQKFVMGFPNTTSSEIHFKKLNWINFGNPIEYTKKIVNTNSKLNIDYNIVKIEDFGNEIDFIWKKYGQKYDLLIPRTQKFLNWRYIQQPIPKFSNYPSEKYFFFIMYDENNPIMYFILKQFGNDKMHILDYFGELTHLTIKNMLIFTENFCQKLNLSLLSLWVSLDIDSNNLKNFFKNSGFTSKNADSYFGIRYFDEKYKKIVNADKKWFITMSDCDIF